MKKGFIDIISWAFPEGDLLTGFTLLFFAGAFLLPSASVWSMIFYVGLLPVTVFHLYKGPRVYIKTPQFAVLFLLMAWTVLTLLWGEDPGKDRVLKFASGSVFMTVYLVGLVVALQKRHDLMRRIGTVFVFAGGINAALSVGIHFYSPVFDDRLGGWGITQHPILGSLIIVISCLFASDRFLRESDGRKTHGSVIILCLIFILLAQSRGAYLSLVASMAVLLCSGSFRQKKLIVVAGVFALGFLFAGSAFFYDLTPFDLIHRVVDRGASLRPEIWSFTLSRIEQAPWLGHGPAAYLGMPKVPFPHNIFLSTLFYYGFIGLVLFLIFLGQLTRILVVLWKRNNDLLLLTALLVNALCGGLTDLAQLATGPKPIWLILWLPVCFILSRAPEDLSCEKKGRG